MWIPKIRAWTHIHVQELVCNRQYFDHKISLTWIYRDYFQRHCLHCQPMTDNHEWTMKKMSLNQSPYIQISDVLCYKPIPICKDTFEWNPYEVAFHVFSLELADIFSPFACTAGYQPATYLKSIIILLAARWATCWTPQIVTLTSWTPQSLVTCPGCTDMTRKQDLSVIFLTMKIWWAL